MGLLFDKKKLVLQLLSQAITVDKDYSVYKYIYVINYGFNELKDYWWKSTQLFMLLSP